MTHTITAQTYLDFLSNEKSDLRETDPEGRDQIVADNAWYRFAASCFDDDPIVMLTNLRDRTNYWAKQARISDLLDEHIKELKRQAKDGRHYVNIVQ